MDYTLYLDTSSLLNLQEKAFEEEFVISQMTLQEIEDIKVSSRKDPEVKHKARNISRLLDKYEDKYQVIPSNVEEIYEILNKLRLDHTSDNIILASAKMITAFPIIVVTDDINMRFISKKIFGLKTKSPAELNLVDDREYTGYREIQMSDEEMAYFYSHIDDNIYDLAINQYIIISNENGDCIDICKWTGNGHEKVIYPSFPSRCFGKVKPLDPIQQCAMDSIDKNDITVLFGRAGSGKTTLPISYFMSKLEKGKIKKCYFIYSFEPLKNAKTLGYEKGDHTTKILYSASIGNILASKYGDLIEVQRLIEDSKIDIIPTANIRGVEFESDSMVIVTEAQNLDVYTLKTILQRCKEGCKQVFEGDIVEQTDVNIDYSGMYRTIEIFKGYEKFGCVKLKNNYRSEASVLADKM